MKVISVSIPAQEKRPATSILHAADGLRIVAFTVEDGQSIPSHVNAGTVTLLVLEGTGVFTGGDGASAVLGPSQMVIYEPNESHGISSNGKLLRFLAFISTPGANAKTVAAS